MPKLRNIISTPQVCGWQFPRLSFINLVAALFFVTCLLNVFTDGAYISMHDICGPDLKPDLTCKRPLGKIPLSVYSVCETCGEFWSGIPGLSYCCTCSDKIFEFCWEAVYMRGGKR